MIFKFGKIKIEGFLITAVVATAAIMLYYAILIERALNPSETLRKINLDNLIKDVSEASS